MSTSRNVADVRRAADAAERIARDIAAAGHEDAAREVRAGAEALAWWSRQSEVSES